MNHEPLKLQPLARTEGLVIKDVDGELLVYDLERDKAHCLNSAAAAIWRRCDGQTSVSGIARAVENPADKLDESLIWLGLHDLHRSHLLEDRSWPQTIMPKSMSRREAIGRIGIGAAVGLPLVISITAPTAVQAAVSCGAKCKPCSTGAECCSGVCINDPAGCNPGTRRCA